MKTIKILAVLLLSIISNITFGQNDSVYIVKGNLVLQAYAISDIDSIIFYRPTTNNINIQEKLLNGVTPFEIYKINPNFLDSLYGKTYQGGIIAYLDTISGKGLIAAQNDYSDPIRWGCSGTLISGANGEIIGTGKQNTIDILASCPLRNIAAKVCSDLILNNYNDWFLPSINELKALKDNLHNKGFGNFKNSHYWSSSLNNSNGMGNVWNLSFSTGIEYSNIANSEYYVRAVRSF
ncbi:MAG: hypothetical protein RLZZ414_758 [Bacteroidota bacterium]|jgi:hypothetical protein